MNDEASDTVLEQAIKKMPAKCRYTLARLNEGATYEEIGAELQVATETAQRLHERAMEYLLEQVFPTSRGATDSGMTH